MNEGSAQRQSMMARVMSLLQVAQAPLMVEAHGWLETLLAERESAASSPTSSAPASSV